VQPLVDVTEQKRLNEAREAQVPWKKWGPYLSERQWGTVREDYSGDGNACVGLPLFALARGVTRKAPGATSTSTEWAGVRCQTRC
jgi:predicted house-cleaning NTP pyrophosphatase (Maf/HAM1 superfamily)